MGKKFQDKKIAIVCDWISDWGGAEVVLTQLLKIFPDADIFTSVFFQHENPVFEGRKVHTSFIQKIPFLNKKHKLSLLLRPLAFESFDLREYDIVISSSSAESKWVITKPDCVHICYCHTPTRYFWSHYDEYLKMMEFGILNPIAKYMMPKLIQRLRRWDFAAAQRPDFFIANSKNTKARIEKYYKRKATVIHPCLRLKDIPLSLQKSDYYFYAGRCIPYKKFDLVVDAFNKNGRKIKIATNTNNALYKELKKRSKPNIEWILTDNIDQINRLHSHAKAFIFPPEEDFWLVPIAAQATGTPVIAFEKWWALETVSRKTGVFFKKQTVKSLNKAIQAFESHSYDPQKIREHAMQFDHKNFKRQIIDFISDKLYNKKV